MSARPHDLEVLPQSRASAVACVREVLRARGLVDPETSANDILMGILASRPGNQKVGNPIRPWDLAVEIANRYGLTPNIIGLRSWKRIEEELGSKKQPIVLVAGRDFRIFFPGLRFWAWPWRSVIVKKIETRGLRRYVHVWDPFDQGQGSIRVLSLRRFNGARAKGMVPVLMWTYFTYKVPPWREVVPFPWSYLTL